MRKTEVSEIIDLRRYYTCHRRHEMPELRKVIGPICRQLNSRGSCRIPSPPRLPMYAHKTHFDFDRTRIPVRTNLAAIDILMLLDRPQARIPRAARIAAV